MNWGRGVAKDAGGGTALKDDYINVTFNNQDFLAIQYISQQTVKLLITTLVCFTFGGGGG